MAVVSSRDECEFDVGAVGGWPDHYIVGSEPLGVPGGADDVSCDVASGGLIGTETSYPDGDGCSDVASDATKSHERCAVDEPGKIAANGYCGLRPSSCPDRRATWPCTLGRRAECSRNRRTATADDGAGSRCFAARFVIDTAALTT